MLLFIAFACFAVLMLAWLAMPDTAPANGPARPVESRLPEGEVSTAHA